MPNSRYSTQIAMFGKVTESKTTKKKTTRETQTKAEIQSKQKPTYIILFEIFSQNLSNQSVYLVSIVTHMVVNL